MEQETVFSGWGFPLLFHKPKNSVSMAKDLEDIQQSFYILFSTKQGERILAPMFGCNLRKFAFEPVNEELFNDLKFMIFDAVSNYELRVILNDVWVRTFDKPEGQFVEIGLIYTVKESGQADQYWLPVKLD